MCSGMELCLAFCGVGTGGSFRVIGLQVTPSSPFTALRSTLSAAAVLARTFLEQTRTVATLERLNELDLVLLNV